MTGRMARESGRESSTRRTPWIGLWGALLVGLIMFLWGAGAAVAMPAGAHLSVGLGATASTPKVSGALAHVPVGPGIASLPASGAGGPADWTSYNWAGYADIKKSGNITEATGEWFVTAVSCANAPKKGSFEVQWVGIDGWGSDTVEQAGTLSYCSGPGAAPQYYTWWEFWPYNDITFVTQETVGDFVQATVLYSPNVCYGTACGVYTLVFQDFDNASNNFVVAGNPSVCDSNGCENGPDLSAECISEAPSGFGYPGYTPLADYGETDFYYCSATIHGHFAGIGSLSAVATVYHINEVDSAGHLMQKTGPIGTLAPPGNDGKSSFYIVWKRLR